jgi:thioredoxin-dependent peroxiredoxin
MLQPGDVAPAFSLPSDDGKTVSLSDFRATNVLLYFFVKALTPG